MNVRALFAAAAICGAGAFGADRAQAQFIFGYAGGATFRGEAMGCGYGYGCGGWGDCGYGGGHSGPYRGQWIHRATAPSGGCSSCPTGHAGRGRHGKGAHGGCYDCTPAHDSGMPVAPQQQQPTPADPMEGESTASGPALFRPISHQLDQSATFSAGWNSYRGGNLALALATLSAVAEREPTNTAARYALALTHFELGDRTAAEAELARAVALESEHPIAGWGKLMERVQGPRRAWLEAARSAK